MREDFLERELEKMCLQSGQENQYAEQLYRKKTQANFDSEEYIEPVTIKEKVKFNLEDEQENDFAPAIIKPNTIRQQPKSPFIFMKESSNT